MTVLNMRAPGMTLMKMPMFCWTWLITAYLLIAVMPVLAGAITMTLTDRHFGTAFFVPSAGGDPVMYQHIFWFFGRSLANVVRAECLRNFVRGARLAGATHLKGMLGDVSAPAARQAFDVVEFDGHRLDVRLKVVGRHALAEFIGCFI